MSEGSVCRNKLLSDLRHPDKFDYENTKRAFNQEVGFVLKTFRLTNSVVQSKEDIKLMISDIQNGRKGYQVNTNLKCNVVNENGKTILCCIILSAEESPKYVSYKQVLSMDEIFDVFAELHMREPFLDLVTVRDKLSNCLILPDLIKMFWKACRGCSHILRPGCYSLNHNYKIVGEMTIFEMSHTDNGFSRMLLYVERNTNFIFLRPLKTNLHEEVANELLTIFCDFGPPQHLDSNLKQFFQKVITILDSLSLPFRLPQIYKSSRDHKITDMESKVKFVIMDWMDKYNNTNWAIGAHIIQWILNTTEVLNTYIRSKVVSGPIENPYHGMFGLLPNTTIIKLNFDRSKLKTNDFKVCSQCYQQVYKIYKCHNCLAICHFMCCRRIVRKTKGLPIFINKCLSCDNMTKETILPN